MKTFGKLPHTTGQGLGAGVGEKAMMGLSVCPWGWVSQKKRFDRKSSSAQLEGNGWIWWTQLGM